MSKIPEGTETKSGEGVDLRTAIAAAAEALGVEENMVHYTLDLAHFRSDSGTSRAMKTVKIIGWAGEEPRADYQAKPEPREDDGDRDHSGDREQSSSRGRDRDRDRGKGRDRNKKGRGRDEERGLKGPEEGTTEASEFAQEWFTTLLGYMDIEGEIVATGSDERVHIRVDAKERAGRLIGRRGATLASIRQVLTLALEKHGELTIDVDVEDNRSDKKESKPRDRKERGNRGRGKDRGPRYSDDKLQALAARAAEKAIETQRSVTINLELNSYGRRVVHLAIAEIEGVSSASEERDGHKVVQVVPD